MRILPLLLLSACALDIGEPPPEAELDAVQLAWKHAVLPLAPRCMTERWELGRLVAGRGEFEDLCHLEPPYDGCYTVVTQGLERQPLIVVLEGSESPELDLHELAHWMMDCSDMGSDGVHEDERVWGKRGVVASAERNLGE